MLDLLENTYVLHKLLKVYIEWKVNFQARRNTKKRFARGRNFYILIPHGKYIMINKLWDS